MRYSTPMAPQTVLRHSVTISIRKATKKSGSPAELFLHRAPLFPGLATIPHKLIDSSEERKKRDEGRSKMIEKMNKNLRELDVFENGEIVYIQDENRKLTIRVTVLNRCKHQGVESSSYMLKKSRNYHI